MKGKAEKAKKKKLKVNSTSIEIDIDRYKNFFFFNDICIHFLNKKNVLFPL